MKPIGAIDVLQEEMLFYRDEAPLICKQLIAQLEELVSQGKCKVMPLIMMRKELESCKDRVVSIAAALANYQSPKLSAVEQKTLTQAMYVLRAPNTIEDKNEWLRNCALENALLADMREKQAEPHSLDSIANDDKWIGDDKYLQDQRDKNSQAEMVDWKRKNYQNE